MFRRQIRLLGVRSDHPQGVPEMDDRNLVRHVGQASLSKLGVVGSGTPDLGNPSGQDVTERGKDVPVVDDETELRV
ncbi:MAG: hypothetical protein ACRDRO_06020 [Pseudonocardiaceae bacterium]